MWFLNIKQTNKKKSKKQNKTKKSLPQSTSPSLDSELHGNATAINFSSFKPWEMVVSALGIQATEVFMGLGQF